jgi:hypothetical protein
MKSASKNEQPTKKKSWEGMKISFLGKASTLIKTGGGKSSLSGGDPGESRKQKGSI